MYDTINNCLEGIVKAQILNSKHIGFDEFMNQALYHPSLGYYNNSKINIGKSGDFTTAPMMGTLFAKSLAKTISTILINIDGGEVLEIGAGTGKLAADLLYELDKYNSPVSKYNIFDTSDKLAQLQKHTLNSSTSPTPINWIKSPEEIKNFKGIIIANEVADALPVQRFCKTKDNIQELRVSLKGNKLEWLLCDNKKLHGLITSMLDINTMPDGYISEYSPSLEKWFSSWLQRLNKGAMLVFDYGYQREELYHLQRVSGTLKCFFKHQSHNDPLINIGQQDITAHVDFTTLTEISESSNIEYEFSSLANFLYNQGIAHEVTNPDYTNEQLTSISKELFTLMSPSEMGEVFKFFAAYK